MATIAIDIKTNAREMGIDTRKLDAAVREVFGVADKYEMDPIEFAMVISRVQRDFSEITGAIPIDPSIMSKVHNMTIIGG